MQANNRRCSVCRNVGHTRTHCMDQLTIQEFENDKNIFNRLMIEKVRRNGYCIQFCHFINEIYYGININKLKFFVNRYGSISNIRKPRLVATYLYHLCNQFIENYQAMTPEIFFVADRERRYWHAKSMGNLVTDNTNHIVRRSDIPGINANISNVIPTPEWRLVSYLVDWQENDYVEKPRFNIRLIESDKKPEEIIYIDIDEMETTLECGICYDMIPDKNMVELGCKHAFCGGCIEKTMTISQNTNKHPSCAFCRMNYASLCVQTTDIKEKIKGYCL